MNDELKQRMVKVEFPKRMLQEYYFKGFNLNDKSIFNHLDIYLEALNLHLADFRKGFFAEINSLTSPEVKRKKIYLDLLISLAIDVEIAYKKEMRKKEHFYIIDSEGNKLLIKYTQSWEYLSLVRVPYTEFQLKLKKALPKVFTKYMRFKAKRHLQGMVNGKQYKEYFFEENIRDKKIKAYFLLNELQKVWIDKEIVETLANEIKLEIVRVTHLDTDFFKQKLL